MAVRYARTHENGLVVAPPKLDCLGLDCYETMHGEGCYVSHHHLYFPREDYANELEQEFRSSSFNIVALPRCIHSLYHRQVDRVAKPSTEIMEAFLQQAATLDELGVYAEDLLYQEKRLAAAPQTKLWSRIEHSPKGRPYFEYVRDDRLLKVSRLAHQITELTTIVPTRQVLEPHVVGARALRSVHDLQIAS